MHTTVAVVGGGYGGITVAKTLDAFTDVILIDPRDAFVHHIAALRSLVDPRWTDRMFFPYDNLLSRGTFLQDEATRVDASSVLLASGNRIEADHIVLATGSAYPFPAKPHSTAGDTAVRAYRTTHHDVEAADAILLLGAGPVGLELAGELASAWPQKTITIVAPDHPIVPGDYPDLFRNELHRQLDALGVRVILGDRLRERPPSEPGEAKTFTVALESGERLTADIWFRCYGGPPATDYLGDDLLAARGPDGRLAVTSDLRLPGLPRVFALGDIIATPEAKQASAAIDHAGVIAANIRTLIDGGGTLTAYRPGPPGIVLPLGPTGGATYAPGWEEHVGPEIAAHVRKRAVDKGYDLIHADILDAETTAELKGADLMVDDFARLFDQP
ncbi:FAD-dependent oxidoreductase [Streptomyces sp. B8F3]|uniref:FAD-dependent oxidoreductase n=1 Tax=unclassified Streptomyces TaxID=2593676 RepID=UPI00325C7126